MDPINFLHEKIEEIARKETLQKEFNILYPNEDINYFLKIIEKTAGKSYREKKVYGYGTFLFFSEQGKMQFHEFILDIICKELNKRKIKYKRPNKKKGEDLFIIKNKKYIELETGLLNKAYNREDLIQRVKGKEKNVIIIILNQNDQRKYKRSKKLKYEWNTEPLIMTIPETMKYLEKLEGIKTIEYF